MAFTKKASILFEAGEPCQEHACPQGDSSNFDDEVKMTSRRCWDNSAKFCLANVDDRERAMTWVAIVSKSFGFVKKNVWGTCMPRLLWKAKSQNLEARSWLQFLKPKGADKNRGTYSRYPFFCPPLLASKVEARIWLQVQIRVWVLSLSLFWPKGIHQT